MDEKLPPVNVKWLKIFSPAVLGILFCTWGVITSYMEMESSKGWSYLGVIALVPVFFGLIVIDVFTKHFFKGRIGAIWVAELSALGLIYWFWFSKFM